MPLYILTFLGKEIYIRFVIYKELSHLITISNTILYVKHSYLCQCSSTRTQIDQMSRLAMTAVCHLPVYIRSHPRPSEWPDPTQDPHVECGHSASSHQMALTFYNGPLYLIKLQYLSVLGSINSTNVTLG